MLHRISSEELTEWQAYFELDPFGNDRGDLQAGIIASTIANVFRGKGQRVFKHTDFMPDFEKREKKQTWEEQLKLVELMNLTHGGKDLRKKDGNAR